MYPSKKPTWKTFANVSVWKAHKRSRLLQKPSNPLGFNLTNKTIRFPRPCVIETGLSDFHKITITVPKM